MRTCFIHAGTHKTATTYLQTFLTLNEAALAAEGLYIPTTGRVSPTSGHHNLAWELNQDPRYDPAKGSLDDLVRELAGRDEANVCLSAEDFEYLYLNPEALRRLAGALTRIDCTVKVIFYLRPQFDYAESLYGTLVLSGLAGGFDEFWRAFVANGDFEFLGRWHFASDYSRLLDAWAEVFGKHNLIIRRYRPARPVDILPAFMSDILPGWRLTPQYTVRHERENVTPTVYALLQRFLWNHWQASDLDESALGPLIEERARGLPSSFTPLGLADMAPASVPLGKANLRLLRRYGVFLPLVTRARFWQALSESLPGRARSSSLLKATFGALPASASGQEPAAP